MAVLQAESIITHARCLDSGFLSTLLACFLASNFAARFLADEFGDALTELTAHGPTNVAIWDDANFTTMTVRLSSRSAFKPQQHWLVRSGVFHANTKWVAGDFDGDGLTDIASATASGTSTVFSIFRSTGTAFVPIYQGPPDGGWGDSVKMVAGDFDGDGKCDIAAVWNNGGLNALVVRRSTGTSFLPGESWMGSDFYGNWADSTVWVAGKFH